jgi:FkbM family methyltransferase
VPPLLRDFLNNTNHKVMYSFGVGIDISFDVALACMFGFQVKLFDPSPHAWSHFERVSAIVRSRAANNHSRNNSEDKKGSPYWNMIRKSPIRSSALEMHSLGLGETDGNQTFYRAPDQREGGSWSLDPGMRNASGSVGSTMSVPVQTIDHIFGDKPPSVLKISVGGLENHVLKHMLHTGSAPLVIFVYFESICCCDGGKPFCRQMAEEGRDTLKQMREAGYEVFEQNKPGRVTLWRKPKAQRH